MAEPAHVQASGKMPILPELKIVKRGSLLFKSLESFSQVIVGLGFPVAAHDITVLRPFSTALR